MGGVSFYCALLLLASPAARPVAPPAGRQVLIRPWLSTAPLHLEGPAARTAAGDALTVSAFRFYVGGLRLRFTDGTTYHDPAAYHLLDAEDASSWRLPLPGAPTRPVAAITFSLGVDSAANVAGALGGPLDPALGMYWAWQSGYINVKLEGTSPSRPAAARHGVAFHLGGYARPNATRRAVTLELDCPTTAATLFILADVDRWLGAAPLARTPDVLVPGPAAAAQADGAAAMFRWADPPISATADAPE